MMNNQSHYKNMIYKGNYNAQPQKSGNAFGGLQATNQPQFKQQYAPRNNTIPYDPFNKPQSSMNSLLQTNSKPYEPSSLWNAAQNPWQKPSQSYRRPDPLGSTGRPDPYVSTGRTDLFGSAGRTDPYGSTGRADPFGLDRHQRPKDDKYGLFGRYVPSRDKHHRRRHRDRYSYSSTSSDSTQYGRHDSSDSNSESDSDYSNHKHRRRYEKDRRFRGLPSHYKKIISEVLKEHTDDKMHDVVYDDVRKRIEELESQGYKAPKGYNKDKHDFAAADMALMDQVARRNRVRDQKKMQNLISLASMGLNWIRQGFSIKWLKTEKLQDYIDESIADGEFDESSERIGMFLKGTIFENPIFNVALKFAQKAGQAHHDQISEEQAILEEQELERKKRQTGGSLHKLNAMRNATQSQNPSQLKSSSTVGPDPPSFSVPPPSVDEMKKAGVPEKTISDLQSKEVKKKAESPKDIKESSRESIAKKSPQKKKPRSFEPMKNVKMLPDQMGNILGGLDKPMQAFTRMQNDEQQFERQQQKDLASKRSIDVFDQ